MDIISHGSYRSSIIELQHVNKYTYAAISLIGAIPGGYFAYEMLMAMITHFSTMPGLMRVITSIAFATGALLAAIPIGILIFVRSESEESDSPNASPSAMEKKPANKKVVPSSDDELDDDDIADDDFDDDFDDFE